jgi:membrane protein
MVERVEGLIRGLDEWAVRRHLTRVTRNAVVGFFEHDTLQYAGSMAYFAVLSVFQVLILTIVLLSTLFGEGAAREFMIERIEQGSPLDTEAATDMIDATLAARGSMTVVSIGFLLFGALGLFSSLTRGVSRVFDAEPPRLLFWDMLRGLLLMVLTGVLVIGALLIGLITGLVERIAAAALADIPAAGIAVSLIGLVVPLLLVLVAFAVVYRVVPARPPRWRDVLPGAALAAILWTVLRFGFTFYVTNFADYNTAFASVATGISFLVFLYLGSVIVLIGAEFAHASADDRTRPDAAGDAVRPASASASPP